MIVEIFVNSFSLEYFNEMGTWAVCNQSQIFHAPPMVGDTFVYRPQAGEGKIIDLVVNKRGFDDDGNLFIIADMNYQSSKLYTNKKPRPRPDEILGKN